MWNDRWIDYGIAEAKTVARMSKDPSTQAGAVIFRPDKTIVSKGYNGFPRGMEDRPEWYFNRDEKLRRIVHSEMNAMLFAREPLDGCILFQWPFMPCDRCAAHVAQAGVSIVVAPDVDDELRARWGASLDAARAIFEDCGVKVILTNPVPADIRKSRSTLLLGGNHGA